MRFSRAVRVHLPNANRYVPRPPPWPLRQTARTTARGPRPRRLRRRRAQETGPHALLARQAQRRGAPPAAICPLQRRNRLPVSGGDRRPRLRKVPLPAGCARGSRQDRGRSGRSDASARAERAPGLGAQVAAAGGGGIRSHRQADRSRRGPGGRAPPRAAARHHRPRGLGQDGRDARQDARGDWKRSLCDALGLSGADGAPALRRARLRKSSPGRRIHEFSRVRRFDRRPRGRGGPLRRLSRLVRAPARRPERRLAAGRRACAVRGFRGVLGAPAGGALTEAEYQALGVRQSLYSAGEARAGVHELFEKYRAWLKEEGLFDLNLVSHAWRTKTEPRYDFVVVDEVQDFTNAELALILDTLKTKHHFLLCGDSHQIVHPNFFSWASVRSLFWRTAEAAEDASAAREISVLQTNFRNTQAVTGLANRLLKIKQARFGSVDRESNFLVRCASGAAGAAQLLKGEDKVLRALNATSRASVRYAVIVLRDEDKAAARPVRNAAHLLRPRSEGPRISERHPVPDDLGEPRSLRRSVPRRGAERSRRRGARLPPRQGQDRQVARDQQVLC